MLSSKKTLAKAAPIMLALSILGVSQSSYAGGMWRRDCQVYKIGGIRVRTCERGYRRWHHRRPWWRRHHHHRRACRTWHDRWGFHRRCFVD